MSSRRDKLRALRAQTAAEDAAATSEAPPAKASRGEEQEPEAETEAPQAQSDGTEEHAAETDEQLQLKNYALAATEDEQEKYRMAVERLALQRGLVESQAEEYVEKIQQEDVLQQVTKSAIEDVLSLAPRKVDWDLKRDIEEKLSKLQRRTQRAIVEMARERLQQQGGGSTAATAQS